MELTVYVFLLADLSALRAVLYRDIDIPSVLVLPFNYNLLIIFGYT